MNDIPSIDDVLTRGVSKVLPSKDGLKNLMLEKKITLYQGFDPSMPSLHLGHYVGLLKLRQFQKLGHKVIFLVGDFTGMIGDPDKISTRIPLTREQTLKNSETWKGQASKVLDFEGDNPAQILYNSEWNDKIEFRELLEIISHFTVQQILERDMFQKRLGENRPIRLHELLYPVTQAIDSIKMVPGGIDLEVGGNDQLFNVLAGRDLMKDVWKKEKYILITKLLIDKEGNKFGKTTGNALFLDLVPNEFFAGIMSFPDEVIELGFELLTEVELDKITGKIKSDPMGQKKRLSFEVVKILWGEKEAIKAQEYFENTFQTKSLESDFQEYFIDRNSLVIDLVSKILGSKTKAKTLMSQGGIDINGIAQSDPTIMFESDVKIKIGKKTFLSVKIK